MASDYLSAERAQTLHIFAAMRRLEHILTFVGCQRGTPEGSATIGRLEREMESARDRLAFIHFYDRRVGQAATQPALWKFDNILISQD
jgi:hypothetical protein